MIHQYFFDGGIDAIDFGFFAFGGINPIDELFLKEVKSKRTKATQVNYNEESLGNPLHKNSLSFLETTYVLVNQTKLIKQLKEKALPNFYITFKNREINATEAKANSRAQRGSLQIN